MWVKLRDSYAAMDEHTVSVEVACASFMATLEPIYRYCALYTTKQEQQ
jgi:hypothetical protein